MKRRKREWGEKEPKKEEKDLLLQKYVCSYVGRGWGGVRVSVFPSRRVESEPPPPAGHFIDPPLSQEVFYWLPAPLSQEVFPHTARRKKCTSKMQNHAYFEQFSKTSSKSAFHHRAQVWVYCINGIGTAAVLGLFISRSRPKLERSHNSSFPRNSKRGRERKPITRAHTLTYTMPTCWEGRKMYPIIFLPLCTVVVPHPGLFSPLFSVYDSYSFPAPEKNIP